MISTLTKQYKQVTNYSLMGADWNVRSLLDTIANSTEPAYNALIDTGALVTGMSNLEVAQYLLQNGLPDMQGVVYLDSKVSWYCLYLHDFHVQQCFK
jgi:hypothetical protein